MALVAKRNQYLAPAKSEQGQISIFFSASLVVFVSIIAFVINVGLFVKAKINLQNATDAAAWAGAAVQARQLSKIAYLNWEMRNVFKEWMYKYYVIGNLSTPGVADPNRTIGCSGGSCTDFRLEADHNAITNETNEDPFNVPSVCIHIAGSSTDICKRFGVPGLPEFGSYSIPGAEDASRAFIDSLIGSKVYDCAERTQLNMLATTTWAYNVMTEDSSQTLASQGPAIMTDRQGAWPKAVELAMRIRNLEKIMNRPTVEKAVCIGAGGNCEAIGTYENEPKMGNERIVKAFYSGYRNLGNQIDNEMKNSFRLRELPPRSEEPAGPYSASNLLIPQPYVKQYVDLKLMMVNYATFYTALMGQASKGSSASCPATKLAIPIPGYPLGFYKNPDYITYYAVKGEADFEGMFNPFSDDTITLTAYAAAKPMGGRIGPMLFKQAKDEQAVFLRTDTSRLRSVPYISTLNVRGTYNFYLKRAIEDNEYAPGVPLPLNVNNEPFWLLSETDPVGGLATTTTVQFGIPNLVYDYVGGSMNPNNYTFNGARLYEIKPADGTNGVKPIGLYNSDMFKAFRGSIGGTVTPDDLAAHIARVRAPTLYEAANYLIPTPNEINKNLNLDSFGNIPGQGVRNPKLGDVTQYTAEFYAPLHAGNTNHNDLLYSDPQHVVSTVMDFMRTQKSAMDNYTRSLNLAAIQIYRAGKDDSSAAAAGAADTYRVAAERISDIGVNNSMLAPGYNGWKDLYPKTCNSLAGQFWWFYYGHGDLYPDKMQPTVNPDECPTPLAELLQQYFANPNSTPAHYKMEYSLNEGTMPDKKRLFTAYVPGPYTGMTSDGWYQPPVSGLRSEQMRRNFYSTKLVTINSLRNGGGYNESSNFAVYSEGDLTSSEAVRDRRQSSYANYLEPEAIAPDIDTIKY